MSLSVNMIKKKIKDLCVTSQFTVNLDVITHDLLGISLTIVFLYLVTAFELI